MGLSWFTFSWRAPKTHIFWNRVRNGRSRSSKVIVFGTNRYRRCDFLLVISSDLGPILPHFRYCRFSADKSDPIHPNFRVFPLDYNLPMLWWLRGAKTLSYIVIRVIAFDAYTHGTSTSQTDGWTGGRTTYDSNTALCTMSFAWQKWKIKQITGYLHSSQQGPRGAGGTQEGRGISCTFFWNSAVQLRNLETIWVFKTRAVF